MRFFVVLLALSTLAAAGPLPLTSNTAVEARATPSTPANSTLGPDPFAALLRLKVIYDSLNETAPSNASLAKRSFWALLKARSEAPGPHVSVNITSTPEEQALGANITQILTDLKAVYDNLHDKRAESDIIAKRGFWHWLKMAFEAPGLKKRTESDIIVKRGFWHWLKMAFEAPGL